MSTALPRLIRPFRGHTSVRIQNYLLATASTRIASKGVSYMTRTFASRYAYSVQSPKHDRATGNCASTRLKSIDYRKLLKRETSELALLLGVCQKDGFFYLDLTDMPSLINKWGELLCLSRKWFALSFEEKMKSHLGTVLHVYPDLQVSHVRLFSVLLTLK